MRSASSDVAERRLEARERDVKAGTLRTVSVEGYRNALSGVLLHVGTVPVQKLTTSDVRHLLVTLATEGGLRHKPLSHRSVVYALTSLRLVLDFAVESGLIQKSPADAVKTPKKPVEDEPEQITTWDRDQLVMFRRYLAGLAAEILAAEPWLSVGYRLILAGLRRSEVLGLAWEAVDFENGQVHVHASRVKTRAQEDHRARKGKGEQLGTVGAGRGARARDDGRTPSALAAPRTARWGFAGHPGRRRRPGPPGCVQCSLRQARRCGRTPHLTEIHHVRHSLARTLHEANFKPIEGASLLGHALTTHLQHYLPTGDEYVRGAEERVRALFADAV